MIPALILTTLYTIALAMDTTTKHNPLLIMSPRKVIRYLE